MRPIRVDIAAEGVSNPIPLDTYRGPFNVGIGVALSPGAAMTYTVEHTFDDVFSQDFDAGTATWYPNSGITNRTASTDGNYAFPVVAVRIRVSAYTSGSARMTLVQAGSPRSS